MEKKNVPKIRFPGFTEPWEQRRLSEVLKNRRITMKQNSEYHRLAFASGQGVIEVKERKTNNRDQLIKDEFDKKYLVTEYNDIVYNPANLKYGAIDRNKLGKGLISPIYVTFTTDEIPAFIERIVKSENFKNKALRFEEGSVTKRQSVNVEDLLTLEIMIAPNKEEQKKIGDIFDSLDNLISLHQRKLENLKKQKKGLLQKMFPEKGKKVPEIRFPEFTDDWEQRKFKEIAETRRGLTYSPSNICNNGVRVLRSSNINEESFEISEDDVFVDEQAVNIPYIKNGDILITAANGSSRLVGKHTIIHDIPDNSAVHGGFMLTASTSYPDFLNASMSSSWYSKFISVFVVGGNGAIGNLNKNDLDEQIVLVPNESEQIKIGAFFKKIDNLISLHQRKLEHLQKQKKALLQQMFV